MYNQIRKMVVNLCLHVPDFSQTTRKECDMWEYTFKEPPAVDLTEVLLVSNSHSDLIRRR